jgi:FMN phosphatase YigB (HAD superfamily)
MIKAILFDLDGTLLPMDQELFLKAYFGGLVKAMVPHGYDPDRVVKSIWDGTAAMVKNNGTKTNEEVFWDSFCSQFGADARKDEPLFDAFYRTEFQNVQKVCGFESQAAELIHQIKGMGYRTILATNPLFPPIATRSRIRWAGLEPEDFEWVTTYDNSAFCKPNPDYYREILRKQNLKAEECVMVGNDVGEDMIAETLGMQVFLLTPCLINKAGSDISHYPQGGFPELLDFIRGL